MPERAACRHWSWHGACITIAGDNVMTKEKIMGQATPNVDQLKNMLTEAVNMHQQGNIDKAMGMYKQVLKHKPDNFVANQFYGVGLNQKGKLRESIPYFKKAIRANPDWVPPYANLALALMGLNRHREALKIVDDGLKKASKNGQLLSTKSQLLSATGRFNDAINTARLALQNDPDSKDAMLVLATTYFNAGKLDEALDINLKIIDKHPDYANSYCDIGVIHHSRGNDREAATWLEKAIDLNPDHLGAHNNLAVCYRAMDDYEKALKHYDKAIELHPEFSEAWSNKGNVLRVMGRSDESMQAYRKAMEINPQSEAAHSNYLMSLHYAEGIERQFIYDETLHWDKKFSKGLKPSKVTFNNHRDPDKKLRVGMVSNSFRKHPVGYMIVKGVEHIDADKVEWVTYSGVPRAKYDQLTERLKNASHIWHDIVGMPDNDLERLMRKDECDLMLDLSGHSETGRLGIFCRRVAPVQVEWVGGLFDTSGLAEMDWIIGDDVEIPKGDDKWYTEKVYRMPDDYICYDPPDYLPDVQTELPAKREGYVMFGNFNNMAKISPTCVRMWSNILKKVEGSKLLLKTKGAGQEAVKDYVHTLFEEHDINPERVLCEEGAPHKEFLENYNRVDIAFDPYPYTGGLSTIEALIMGVPVITMPSEHFAGRHAATHLTNAGLPEWIVEDEKGYEDLAITWASDLDRLEDLRGKLRDMVMNSPLTDGPRFAGNLEKAFRHMWHDYLKKSG